MRVGRWPDFEESAFHENGSQVQRIALPDTIRMRTAIGPRRNPIVENAARH